MAAHIRAQVYIQKIPLDLIAGHALVASVLDKVIQVLPRKRRRNGKVHTRREQQAFVGGGVTGITSVRAYKNCNADLLKEQERIRQIV
ncbi:hypothetical protein DWV55_01900 [Butyricicoccus sp. AF10-3]|nr:hypothetical protein DWV55_01900 [Butyricicoccus sp. AF10-3]